MSKPVATILLLIALAGAMLAGGFIATRQSGPTADQIADRLVPVDAPQPSDASPSKPTPAAPGGDGRRPVSRPPKPDTAESIPPVPARPLPPAAPQPAVTTPSFVAVEVPSGQIIDIELQTPLTTETAKVEDPVECRVTKDVRVGQTVVIPAGAKLIGSVSVAEPGGRIKEVARLGVRLHTLTVPGVESGVPVTIDPLVLDGPAQAGDSKKKIAGGAAAGAGLGWMKGGIAGAITGAAVGGGAGTATKIVEGRKPAVLPAGSQARVELRGPIQVTVRQ